MHKGRAAGRINERGARDVPEAGTRGAIPVGLEADEYAVVEFDICPVGDAEVADVPLEPDQPVRIELPVVSDRGACRESIPVHICLAFARAAAEGNRAGRGPRLVAESRAVITADVEAGPVEYRQRR